MNYFIELQEQNKKKDVKKKTKKSTSIVKTIKLLNK